MSNYKIKRATVHDNAKELELYLSMRFGSDAEVVPWYIFNSESEELKCLLYGNEYYFKLGQYKKNASLKPYEEYLTKKIGKNDD